MTDPFNNAAWTDEQIIKQMGSRRQAECLWYATHAIMCDACDRRVAAQFLWRNADSIINEAVAELEEKS